MNMMWIFAILLQIIGTPIADGSFVVSTTEPLYPDLPADIQPTPINDDWELLYYRVTPLSDGYVVDGEIRNITDSPLSTAELIVTTADGMEMGIHPDIATVPAGGRAPFHSDVDSELTESLNRSTELNFDGICEFYDVAPNLELDWEFSDVAVEWEIDGQRILVTGTVTYQGQGRVERIVPTVFGFTSDGYYIGSRNDNNSPRSFFESDTYEFEIDQGFESFLSSDPFAAAARENTFVIAMAPWVGAYGSCAGN